MKKKIIKIGSIVLAIVLVVAVLIFLGYKLYKINLKNNLNNEKWISNHISLTTNNGIGESMYTVNKNKNITPYNMLYQDVIDKMINKKLKQTYTVDSPLMIYNPYGTNNNAVNVYFDTDESVKVSYTIEASGYADFSETLYSENEYTKHHQYQLLGFVMGCQNTLTLTLENEDGETTDYKYILDFSDYKIAVDNKLEITEDNSDELSNGLFAILGDSSEVQDYIHLVDNNGIVRGEIPIIGYRALNLLFKEDKMYFSISETKMAEMNNLGKITKKYDLGKYKLHHDYAFDTDKENLLILASDTTKESCEDAIIKLNLKSGEITDSFYLEEVLPDVRKKAYYNEAEVAKEVESKGVDWMHINTINYLEDDTVILSSRETSSIIKVKNIFENPKIDYILGDKTFWDNYDEKEYLYEKIGDFTIAGGQHTVSYIQTDEEGVYYLSMFNNNLGISTTVPDFDWAKIGLKYSTPKDKGKSYYYKYKVDENNKTFELVQSFEVPFSAYMASTQDYDNNIIVDSAMQCIFDERDNDGKIKKQYKLNCESNIYRVFKYNFNNFYFKN